MSGDAVIYKYTVEETTIVKTLELHEKALRDIEFSLDGNTLYSTSKDRMILLSDLETGKFVREYTNAHEQPVSRMLVFGETEFATGSLLSNRSNQLNYLISLHCLFFFFRFGF